MKKMPALLLSLCIPVVFFASCASDADSASKACLEEAARLEANKKMVVEFYQQLFGDKNIDVIDDYLKEDYIQHNPMLPDGRDTLKSAARMWFGNAPKTQVDFQKVAADGDLVWLHIKTQFGDKTVSVVDIFRIEDGKIAEHWDVIQEVPEESANDHPMF